MQKWIVVLGCAVLAGCSSASKTVVGKSMNPNFEVQGHRGARWVRPENTLSAFKYALENGADTLEMDLHATKDNVLVVTHDPLLNPDFCLDPKGNKITKKVLVRSLTLKELKQYDCGALVNPRFPMQVAQKKERIPTFEELLKWLETDPNPRARKILLNVETKSEAEHPEFTPEPKPFTQMVMKAFKKHEMMDRVTLQSFDYRTLVVAREIDPSVTISVLVEDRPKEALTELAKRYGANIISPNHEWLTKADVDSLHAMNVRVIPWTPNSVADWKKLYEFGVDGMISDNPKALLEFRASIGGKSPY